MRCPACQFTADRVPTTVVDGTSRKLLEVPPRTFAAERRTSPCAPMCKEHVRPLPLISQIG